MWLKDRSREIINTVILTQLLLVMGFILVLFYWMAIDNNDNPVKMEVLPYQYQVEQGSAFNFAMKVDRLRTCPVKVDRIIRNVFTNEVHNVGTNESVIYEKESIIRKVVVDRARFLESGVYSYELSFSYYCNPSNNILGPIRYGPIKVYFQVFDKASLKPTS